METSVLLKKAKEILNQLDLTDRDTVSIADACRIVLENQRTELLEKAISQDFESDEAKTDYAKAVVEDFAKHCEENNINVPESVFQTFLMYRV